MSEWIEKAAKQQNQQRLRQRSIAELAPTLWENITRTIEADCQQYAGLNEQTVQFSGRADHTIWVAVYQRGPEIAPEKERVTITYHQENHTVELLSSRADTPPRLFTIGLNSAGNACLMEGGSEVSIQEFSKLALRKALFPDLDS